MDHLRHRRHVFDALPGAPGLKLVITDTRE